MQSPPAGFEQPGFDDSAFNAGNGAFGNSGNWGPWPLGGTIQTNWPLNTQLMARRQISIPLGATGVRVMAAVDNDILGVFFNGVQIAGFVGHEHYATLDQVGFDVPQALIQPGLNVVAFDVQDRGDISYFDSRIIWDGANDLYAGTSTGEIDLASGANLTVGAGMTIHGQGQIAGGGTGTRLSTRGASLRMWPAALSRSTCRT